MLLLYSLQRYSWDVKMGGVQFFFDLCETDKFPFQDIFRESHHNSRSTVSLPNQLLCPTNYLISCSALSELHQQGATLLSIYTVIEIDE